MTIAYFDCFAGAAGDMIVGSLLDAGCDFNALQAELAKLQVPGYRLRAEKVHRSGLAGTQFHVELQEHDHAHRHLSHIVEIIQNAGLSPRVTERAIQVFTRLAHAEAKVHNMPVEKVHFHEVGAIDSLVDIIGGCIALELMGVNRLICSPIPVGCGTIRCAHGEMPNPAPATAELLIGSPVVRTEIPHEMTTPTAAAMLTALAESFGPIPSMNVSAVGYGAGTRDGGPRANLLRVFLGQEAEAQVDHLIELSANIDDCSGELIGVAMERLLAAGCVDAWATPIYMKKSRPAWMVCVLAHQADVARAEEILFTETTTFGIRRRTVERSKLIREFKTVETPFGEIRMKLGRLNDREVTAAPEFSDCHQAAETHHVSVRTVMAAAETAYRKERDAR